MTEESTAHNPGEFSFQRDDLFVRCNDVQGALVDGSLIILNASSGKYHSISGSGIDIWEWLSQPISRLVLAEKLEVTYGLDASTALSDVSAFLEQLQHAKCIEHLGS